MANVLPTWLEEKLTEETEAGYNNGHFNKARALAGVPEGERDTELFKLACSLRAGNVDQDLAEGVVSYAAANCEPPLPEDAARQKVDNAYGAYAPGVGPKIHSRRSHSLIGTGTVGMDESTNVVHLKKPLQAVSLGTVARPKPRRWVVEELFPRGHMSLIYAEGGMTKSFLAMHLAASVADEGTDTWLGYNIVTAPVLYLDFELDQEEQARRAHDIAAGMGLEGPPGNLFYIGALGAPTHEAFQAALADVEEHKIELVVVDSLGLALDGDAESSTDVIGFVREYIDLLREAGATILALDHQAKRIKGDRYGDKTAFGSVYKTNLARSVLQVDGTWNGSEFLAELSHKKANFGPKQPKILASVKFGHDRIGIEPSFDFGPRDTSQDEPETAAEKVLKTVRDGGPMYNADIVEAADIDTKTVGNRVSDLVRKGLLEHTGNKKGNSKEVRATSTTSDQGRPEGTAETREDDALGGDHDEFSEWD